MFFNILAEESTDTTTPQTNPWLIWVVLGVVLVLFIAYTIWSRKSARKRQEEAQNILDNLQVGDIIMTIGGIYGKIVQVNNKENSIVIETGSDTDKSFIKIDKVAFHHIISEGPNHKNTATKVEDNTSKETKTENK